MTRQAIVTCDRCGKFAPVDADDEIPEGWLFVTLAEAFTTSSNAQGRDYCVDCVAKFKEFSGTYTP
jgi:hypothetical protein